MMRWYGVWKLVGGRKWQHIGWWRFRPNEALAFANDIIGGEIAQGFTKPRKAGRYMVASTDKKPVHPLMHW